MLKVSSADDHSKNAHDCMAEYELLVMGLRAGSPGAAQLLSSDAGWGRRLSGHLDGFSLDGRRIFGIIAEAGSFPVSTLFDYDVSTGNVKLMELKKGLTLLTAVQCGTTLAVAGTTKSGAIVLKPNTNDPCERNYRWQMNAATGELERIGEGTSVIGLYGQDTR